MKYHPEDLKEIEEQIYVLKKENADIQELICRLIEIVKLQQEQFTDIRKIRELEKSIHRIEHLQKHG